MVQENTVKNKKVIVVCGPTASGKTAFSITLAKLLDTEIISADSMNVYKGLNIGTAKPTLTEMQGVKHHLIDVCDIFDTFSVGDYKERAKPVLEDILSKGKIPIICGGTGFYINSLLFEYSYGKSGANLEVREYYKNLAIEKGNEYVYDILKEKDPKSAEKLHFNDVKRVVRALEICSGGTLKSELNDSDKPIYDFDAYMIDYPRDLLYERIEKRVDLMIESGLVGEVENLIKQGVSIENQCMQGIGYKEIFSYLNGETSLEQAVDLIKLNTRHYAKRQITFFKRYQNLKLIDYKDTENFAKSIVENL